MSLYENIDGTTQSTLDIGVGAAGDKSLRAVTAAALPPTLKYDDTLKEWTLAHDGATFRPVGVGLTEVVTKTGHSWTVGTAVYHDATTWQKARANAQDTLASAVVVRVVDVNTVELAFGGRVTVSSHGLTLGVPYYLSQGTAGLLTTTIPTVDLAQTVLVADTANTWLVVFDTQNTSIAGLDLQFTIAGVATSTNVTAANLNTLTGGSSTTLHSHAAPAASAISTSVTSFNGELTSSETTVQAALDKLDDHAHTTGAGLGLQFKINNAAVSTNVTASNLNALTGGGSTTLHSHVVSSTASGTATTVASFNGVLTSSETDVQKALDKLDDHAHTAAAITVDTGTLHAPLTGTETNSQLALNKLADAIFGIVTPVAALRIAIGTNALYTAGATIPTGAIVYDATLVVDTAYSAGSSLTAYIDGASQPLLFASIDANLQMAGVYTKLLHIQPPDGSIKVQVRGAPSVGAAHLIIRYTTMPSSEDAVSSAAIDGSIPMAIIVKSACIISDALATPPANPQPLDCYRVPSSPQGAWSAITVGNLVVWDEQTWQDLSALSANDRVVVAPSSRTPAGTFASQGGKVGTWSGSAWSFTSPTNADVAVVVATAAPDIGTLYCYGPTAWWSQNALTRVSVGNTSKSATVVFQPQEVTTTDATVTAVSALTVTPSLNCMMDFDVSAQAIKSDGSVAATIRRSATFRRVASAPVQSGGTLDAGTRADSAALAWDTQFVINGNAIETRITGQSATTISWTVSLTVTRRTV